MLAAVAQHAHHHQGHPGWVALIIVFAYGTAILVHEVIRLETQIREEIETFGNR